MADFLRNGVYIFILLIVASEIYKNTSIGLGSFMLVITAASQLQNITTSLFVNAISIFSDMKYMRDFFDLMETEREYLEPDAQTYECADIEFSNVSFKYPNSDIKALDGLNIKIKQGEKVAIVGANGSGKSTFVNLLCGLYESEGGNVKINQQDVCKNISKVRRSLSVIFQNFCSYQDTLRNNITVSDQFREPNDDEIHKLATKTGANEVIQNQKEGLNEIIGVFSENGNNLSGGQWQKIAITRALYRKNARIFILDEPTAALDPISESNIYKNFANLTGDKTTILISHRLGITSVVDRILVFDNGKIVEDGNHNELMLLKGIYAKMYNAQAQWYRDLKSDI